MLAARLDAIARGSAFGPSAGVLILDAATGRPLFQRQPGLALVPASTLKLIVGAAALHDLGPDFRFATSMAAGGRRVGGTLAGNLWLVGGGDPELTSDDLRRGIGTLRRAGMRAIGGNVYADGSIYGPDEVNATWLLEDLPYGWAAPPSAVTINGGSEEFTIIPSASGGPAAIKLDPPGAVASVTGTVMTAPAWADNTLRIMAVNDGAGFEISGHVPYGPPQKYWLSLAHPTQSAAFALRAMLLHAGLEVRGGALVGKAPTNADLLWRHQSHPLAAIVRRMNVDSDNHIAEQLLREIGLRAYGVGTLDHGLAAERAFLMRLGIDDARVDLADGSGLSTGNRIPAAVLAAVLRAMDGARGGPSMIEALPRVGAEGTVRYHRLAPDAIGRVVGKSGYIAGATGLAGYVRTARHGLAIYVFLVNDWPQGLDAVWSGEDRILDILARS